jgi:predicted nucleic acid-binding protein
VIVIDASVLVSALIDDGAARRRTYLRLGGEDTICAPEIVDLEIANAWRRDLRLGRIDEERSQQALEDLAVLPLVRVPHKPLMDRIWELRHNLSAYDASYVALAEILGTTLLTADGRMVRAPRLRCEIELLADLEEI